MCKNYMYIGLLSTEIIYLLCLSVLSSALIYYIERFHDYYWEGIFRQVFKFISCVGLS